MSARRIINSLLAAFGYQIARAEERSRGLADGLDQIKRVGFRPATVIDVGAADGTPALTQAFPEARHIMIEPLAEYEATLQAMAKGLPQAQVIIAAAAAQAGQVTLNVHDDLLGSSLMQEADPSRDGQPRTVTAITVDGLVEAQGLAGPVLIKVDVQGAELEVMRGAETTLAQTEVVILEASLFGFFRDGPQLADVIAFMVERGFAVYDLVGQHFRPLDGALAQIDVIFAREGGLLRRDQRYQ
ncbi:MAG: FkbM family methyltransferase [Chloroflexi bacterium]|nr:FkbM family methyltransferase [Chloroflexota bacterium]